jgi:ElaB/YqjD/DUF883 family membrane-anchored ribosome-binding protein
MDNELEVTHADLDETRASLSEKLETLEQHVVDSVQGATAAVSDTVESVKDAVRDTVATVRETLDIPLQVKRRPWGMVGGSIALGFLGGCLLRRRGSDRPSASRSQPAFPDSPRLTQHRKEIFNGHRSLEEASAKKPIQEVSQGPREPGWLGGVNNQFEAEITKLKGLAIGTVLGIVRDLITQSGPEQMKAELANVMDNITVKLGGEPIRGPVLKNNLRAKEEGNECSTSENREAANGNPAARSNYRGYS